MIRALVAEAGAGIAPDRAGTAAAGAADAAGGAGQAGTGGGAGAGLSVRRVRLPEPGPGQIRVRIRAAGVCHSDLSMVDGTVAARYPLVLGHEAAGVVTWAGAGVTRVLVGQQVVLNWAPPCRHCWFCARGEPWLCERAGASAVERGSTADGGPLFVALGLGALAEEVVIDEGAAIAVPDALAPVDAALLGCAVLTGVGAVRNSAAVRPGDSVVVVGLGGVGLAALLAARAAGADPVLAVDVSPEKRDLALRAGATEFLLSDGGLGAAVRARTGGRGADHAIECVGRAAAIRAAWRSTRRGGTVTVVGMGSRHDVLELSAMEIFHFARTLRVSVYGSADVDHAVPELAREVLAGRLDLTPLVSHRITLDEAPAAFDRMRRGEGARSVVCFD